MILYVGAHISLAERTRGNSLAARRRTRVAQQQIGYSRSQLLPRPRQMVACIQSREAIRAAVEQDPRAVELQPIHLRAEVKLMSSQAPVTLVRILEQVLRASLWIGCGPKIATTEMDAAGGMLMS